MKKRILSIALALVFCASLSISSLAADTVTHSVKGRGDSTVAVTLTGVLSQDSTPITVNHAFPNFDEQKQAYEKCAMGTEQVNLVYTVSHDFTVMGPTWEEPIKEENQILYGPWEGFRLMEDGTYETMGIQTGGDYYFYRYSGTQFSDAYPETTLKELLAECDLYSVDLQCSSEKLWIRFEDKAAQPTSGTVAPSPCKAALDENSITLNAYLFSEGGGGVNYVMLRDVAYLLNGSETQFKVDWSAGGIALTTGQAYTPVGGELQSKGDGPQAYIANQSAITIDGKTVTLNGYTIGGNNYFKLRDLGEALGFGVNWSSAFGRIEITSAKK